MLEIPRGIAAWLQANQQRDGRVVDPLHAQPGTYADGFAGLVFALLAEQSGDGSWSTARDASLRVARNRPADSEFDQLALLLLGRVTEHNLDGRTVSLYRGNRTVSNNWVAMRALSHTLRARLGPGDADAAHAAELWKRVVEWQLPDGLWIDSPIGTATPITYHAKFCAMVALALVLAPDECPADKLAQCLRRGLEALATVTSPTGTLVPFGRSRNTLFGYAAAVVGFAIGARLFSDPAYAGLASTIGEKLGRHQHTDGHIPCVLNDGEAERVDWDVYVNNPDYNAYAAGLLLVLERIGWNTTRTPTQPVASGVSAVGPVIVVRESGLFVALAGAGQSAPWGTPFFSDFRYYGMQPLLIEADGETAFTPAAYQWRGEDRQALVDPAASMWIPYVQAGDRRYCARTYDGIQTRVGDGWVELHGVGHTSAYGSLSRWHRGARNLLSEVTGWPLPQYSIHCGGHSIERTLELDLRARTLRGSTSVRGQLPGSARLHQDEQLLQFSPIHGATLVTAE